MLNTALIIMLIAGALIGYIIGAYQGRHYTVTHKQGGRYQVDWNALGQPLQYDPVILTCGGCGRAIYAPDGFTPEPHDCDGINATKIDLPLASIKTGPKVVPLPSDANAD